MPAIPQPGLIQHQPDPDPVDSDFSAWDDTPVVNQPPADLRDFIGTVPPVHEWPAFNRTPERVVPARREGETDAEFLRKQYNHAVHWAAEDAAQARAAAAEAEKLEARRKAAREAVQRHRARKAAAGPVVTPEEQAARGEITAINAYVHELNMRIAELRKGREVALERKQVLLDWLASSRPA